jgi:hypothetical protein
MDNELFSPHTTVVDHNIGKWAPSRAAEKGVKDILAPRTVSCRPELAMPYGIFTPPDLGKWVPRAEPVIAKDGALFWVVEQHGQVMLATWKPHADGGRFRSLTHTDEGMCGFAVSFYQPITKPEAPTC